MLKRKQGTIMRPITQTMTNDKGFGQRVYNPDDKSWAGMAKNAGASRELHEPAGAGRRSAAWTGQTGTDDTDKLKVLGPLAGVTFSKGAPGGPEVGEMYHENRVHQGTEVTPPSTSCRTSSPSRAEELSQRRPPAQIGAT
jgi:hypothetical protein